MDALEKAEKSSSDKIQSATKDLKVKKYRFILVVSLLLCIYLYQQELPAWISGYFYWAWFTIHIQSLN